MMTVLNNNLSSVVYLGEHAKLSTPLFQNVYLLIHPYMPPLMSLGMLA